MIKLTLFTLFSLLIHYLTYKIILRFKIIQPIYELSPKTHQAKHNTPTMGGLSIILCIILGFFIFYHYTITPHIWILILGLGFAFIGLLDDILSLRNQKNKGFSARQKFLFQLIFTTIMLFIFSKITTETTSLWIWIFYGFVIIGSANATNLSDGLDGLLSGLASLSLLGFFIWVSLHNRLVDASLILIFFIGCSTFLLVNHKPAKIFMGDTGSLCIGALLAGLSIYLGNPWLLLSFGAVYVIETASVILQVLSFKLFKTRLFLMSPLHHHFELLGLSENKTVYLFWFMGLCFMIIFFMIW